MTFYEDYQEVTDYAFAALDKSYVSTGILYDSASKTAHPDAFSSSKSSSSGH